MDGAEAVFGLGPRTLDVVSALRDKSLLFYRTSDADEVRLDLYRSVRAFAASELAETEGARESIEARHAEYFAERCAAALGRAPRAPASLDAPRILLEEENLLAVIERVAREKTVSAHVALPALRVMLALFPVLFARGPLRAYEVLVDPAIAATRGSGADPSLVAQVLLVRGALLRHRGAAAAGARDLVQALGIARTLADASLEARATLELGHALDDAGDLAAAEDHFRRAGALHASVKERREEGRAAASLAGLYARTERAPLARELLERALSLHAGDLAADREDRAEDLRALGAVELACGNLALARTRNAESLALARLFDGGIASAGVGAAPERRGAVLALTQRGLIAERAGDRGLARESFLSAMATSARLGFEALAATADGHLGVLAQEEGKIAEAEARLSSAAATLAALGQSAAASFFGDRLRALGDAANGAPLPPKDALVVAADGTWFRAAYGQRVGLERRRPLARIAARLAAERLERPGSPLASRVLQAAAWPGEKLAPAAGAHRLRVAISTLRKIGVPILTEDLGYALDASLPLVRA